LDQKKESSDALYEKLKPYNLTQDTQISQTFNFVHKTHVDHDFKWDGNTELFQLETLLGAGAFGEVWKAIQVGTGFSVAIKIVRNMSGSEEETTKLKKEMDILKKCHFESLVQYYGYSQIDSATFWILMEYCEVGALKDLIETERLPEKIIAEIIAQTLRGLAYLHSINLVHRDVKAANVLIAKQGQIKLGDFGLAEHLSALVLEKRNLELSGSMFWMAPEIKEHRHYSNKSDIWALGITLIEICENTPPFNALQKQKKFSDELQNFIEQCLVVNLDKRPDSHSLLNHSFIKGSKGPSVLKDIGDLNKKQRVKRQQTLTMTIRPSPPNSQSQKSLTLSYQTEIEKLKKEFEGVVKELRDNNTALSEQVKDLAQKNTALTEKVEQLFELVKQIHQ